MSELHLLVMIEVQPGKRNEQIAAFESLRPHVLAESGCLHYELMADQSNENAFVIMEKWENQAALDAHDQMPHMLAADAANKAFRAKPASVIKLRTA
ncbi:antibiotic biosynthesis monooxygenase [Leeia sp. TBRC 13508]|uniref:Antibiotic biosynthesis monooxygenase n=1 Tax=Leeia speluncae TaxID=2884804 RepID=A0ABS8D7X5_9NEIS|nr:antibiotic biosynthesis monooxygenase family protein [Leeia speluncae]MCB6184232.1 antibiotic biosynthesis monooxygenase [Leeia speluncae]